MGVRRLTYQQIEALYDSLLHPTDANGLAPKTVYEIPRRLAVGVLDAVEGVVEEEQHVVVLEDHLPRPVEVNIRGA